MKHHARLSAAVALTLALNACSVSSPVRVTTPQLESMPHEVAIDPGKEPSTQAAHFAARFERRLTALGRRVHAEAPYRLSLALASHDSSIGIAAEPGKDAKSIAWQSEPRKRSLFDGCKPQRLRAVAVGSLGTTALTSLHAEAELDTCKENGAELDRLADALAEAISRR